MTATRGYVCDDRGYFSLPRGLRDHPCFQGSAWRWGAYTWLVERAAWRPMEFGIRGQKVQLERGQVCVSLRQLMGEWGQSMGNVQRFLARLQTDALTDARTDHGRLVLTLRTYDGITAPQGAESEAPGAVTGAPPIHGRFGGDALKNSSNSGNQESPPGGTAERPSRRGQSRRLPLVVVHEGGRAEQDDRDLYRQARRACAVLWPDKSVEVHESIIGALAKRAGSHAEAIAALHATVQDAAEGKILGCAKAWLYGKLQAADGSAMDLVDRLRAQGYGA